MPEVVCFDVDGVLAGSGNKLLPGAHLVVATVEALGYEVHLWSAGGAGHAVDVGRRLGVTFSRCHAKPARPIHPMAARSMLGVAPVLTVDNDPAHTVAGWHTLIVESRWS